MRSELCHRGPYLRPELRSLHLERGERQVCPPSWGQDRNGKEMKGLLPSCWPQCTLWPLEFLTWKANSTNRNAGVLRP